MVGCRVAVGSAGVLVAGGDGGLVGAVVAVGWNGLVNGGEVGRGLWSTGGMGATGPVLGRAVAVLGGNTAGAAVAVAGLMVGTAVGGSAGGGVGTAVGTGAPEFASPGATPGAVRIGLPPRGTMVRVGDGFDPEGAPERALTGTTAVSAGAAVAAAAGAAAGRDAALD